MHLANRYGLEIRTATSADAADLAGLLNLTATPAEIAERLGNMRQGTALIATSWGPPSGIVVLHWFQTLEAGYLTADISTLFVAPDDRRRGIGRLLLKAAAQAARVAGCDMMEISTLADHTELPAFCLANGFAQTGLLLRRGLRKKEAVLF